jgi:methyl-accepting chemotaxis protein
VVASEVRALAQRSSQAAKEIKSLIGASSNHVGSGVKFVGQSGEALKEIVGEIIEISSLVAEIAEATKQQSIGIQEISTAISQMDQVTQQNAAMVEESTAAAHALAGEADNLSSLVVKFNISQHQVSKAVSPQSQAHKVVSLRPRQAGPAALAAPVASAREDCPNSERGDGDARIWFAADRGG